MRGPVSGWSSQWIAPSWAQCGNDAEMSSQTTERDAMASTALETQSLKPVESMKFQPIDLSTIQRSLNYKIALQMGSMARWRKYYGRKRKVVPSDTPGKVNYVHDPKIVYVDEAISGSELAGMVQSHNDWIEAYRSKDPADSSGHVDRQMMILAFEQTSDLPPSLKSKKVDGSFVVDVMRALVQKEFADHAQTKNPGKA